MTPLTRAPLRKSIPRSIVFLAALLALAGAATAQEAGTASVPRAAREYTLLIGYGTTHPGLGATRSRVRTAEAMGRFGCFLSDEMGEGWVRGRHELLVELPLHLALDPRTRAMTGLYLNGSWKFTGVRERGLYPYVFAGGGALYVDLGLPTMGSRLNFCYQGGAGLQVLLRKDLAVTAEYRYHHISNAGTADPNEPLNSSKVLLGISLFR